MKVLNSIEEFNSDSICVLSIGTFDGIHLGHQKIFEKMQFLGKDRLKVIITFEKPSMAQKREKKLINYASKLELLKQNGIDIVIDLNFTERFSTLSYLDFLKYLKQKINFSHLILGKDASFGYKKEGTEDKIKLLENLLNFQGIYIPKVKQNNLEVSCTAIKKLIKEGEIFSASLLLGRQLSIHPSEEKLHLSKECRSLLIDTDDLILPPCGRYLFKIGMSEFFLEGKIKKTQIEIRLNDKMPLDFKKNISIAIYKCS